MPISKEEYDFIELAGENTGYRWGYVDEEGRLHLDPMAALLVYRDVPLQIVNREVFPQLIVADEPGANTWFGLRCREMGLSREGYCTLLKDGGVVAVLPFFREMVR